jgi:hypothetical protein
MRMHRPARPAARVLTTVAAALLPVGAVASVAAANPEATSGVPGGAASSAPAATTDPATAPGGWQRYHAQSFTTAAGELCRFRMHSEVLFDQEYVRTTETYADGKPKTQEFVGPLVVRVTNRDSGRSVVRDLSGRAIVEYGRDGSFDFRLQGPAAVGFHPGDSLRPGYYLLRGEHVVHFAASGKRTVLVDRGTEESLCRTLS